MLLAAGGGMAGGESAGRESEFAFRLLARVACCAGTLNCAERFRRPKYERAVANRKCNCDLNLVDMNRDA